MQVEVEAPFRFAGFSKPDGGERHMAVFQTCLLQDVSFLGNVLLLDFIRGVAQKQSVWLGPIRLRWQNSPPRPFCASIAQLEERLHATEKADRAYLS